MRLLATLLLLSLALGLAHCRPKRSRARSSEESDAVSKLKVVKASTCGYDSCPVVKEGVLNVHLIPHTHDDVGWLKTVDQYYYGSRTMTQKAGVQYILDSVIDALIKDPTRRFVYVETAFFWMWWKEQGDQRRHHVKRLVAEGRLEFAGGAWTMNDEATTYYQSVVDQFAWGLRLLNDTFGPCGRPRTGWQIDPFGHSREMANLFAGMGYDGLLLGRADYQDKGRRFPAKEAEMLWRGSDDLGKSSDLFTGIMFNTYSPPPGFCFDILCADDPIIDDVKSPDYNVDIMVKKFLDYAQRQASAYRSNNIILTMGDDFFYQDAHMWFKNLDKLMKFWIQVKKFMDYLEKQASAYKTNNIIITMGEDFHYQDAHMWFKNLDKLIKYVNEKETKVKLFYSTPSCYIKSLHDSNIKWPVKQDDFFPYASDGNSYWTGYFSSRPTLKYFERKANNFLQVCKQLYAMTNLNEKDKVDLNMLRSAMGIMQHHDAVTGTEKQHVARDYARILEEGMQDCLITTRESLNDLMSEKPAYEGKHKKNVPNKDAPYLPMTICELNMTQCSVTEESYHFVVTVYNPLGHVINHYVRLPVTDITYTVKDPQGNDVNFEVIPIGRNLKEQMKERQSNAVFELIFLAVNLPPLGYRSFYITSLSRVRLERSQDIFKPDRRPRDLVKQDGQAEEMMADQERKPVIIESGGPHTLQQLSGSGAAEATTKLKEVYETDYSIQNENIKISVDPKTGLIGTLFLAQSNVTIPLVQELMYYEGETGNNEVAENRSSGAYIFRPKGASAKPITTKPENRVHKGVLVQELYQKFSDWATQIVRIYKGQEHVEFEWLVGPIPVEDKIGKEVISRFSTQMVTKGIFYTDANGRQLLERKLNSRPTWDLDLKEPVAGNYYPVTTMIALHDSVSQMDLSVLTDRAQGGSSLKDGQLELMVHRRLLHDDAFGVDEALNEQVDGRGLVAKGTHYLYVGKSNNKGSVIRRQLVLTKQLEPTIFFTPAENISYVTWQKAKNEFSGLNTELPANVHLLTLEPWKDNTVLVRLEHFISKTDDPEDLSQNVTVNLKRLFSGIDVLSVRETTLGGNQFLEDSKRFEWVSEEFKDNYYVYERNSVPENTNSSSAKDDYLTKLDDIRLLIDENREIIARVQKTIHDLQKSKKKMTEHKKDRSEYANDYYPTAESNYIKQKEDNLEDGYLEITLEPMQIRTFIVYAKFLDL